MKILKIGNPKKLGFYQIRSYMSCQFTLFANSVEASQKLKGPGQNIHTLLGNLFHLLIERLSNVSGELNRLEEGKKLIDEESDRLREDPNYWWLEPLFTYSKTAVLLNKVVQFNSKSYLKDTDAKSEYEYDVSSKDELFFGRIDKIVFSNSKLIEIHEYKSIINTNDLDFVTVHRDQLEFYSGILFEKYNDHSITGLLFSGELEPTIIKFQPEETRKKLDDLRSEIEKTIQNSSRYTELQNPTLENCLNCKLKPVCVSYLERQKAFGDYDGFVVSGELISITEVSRFSAIIKVEADAGKISIAIPKLHPFLNSARVGNKYVFSDLKKVRNKFEVASRTVTYEIK